MKPPPTTATIVAIGPPGSRLTRAGKPLAIGDRVTASDALTLATPGGVGGCVSLTAQIGVRIATVKLAPVEAPAPPQPEEPTPGPLRPDDAGDASIGNGRGVRLSPLDIAPHVVSGSPRPL